MSQQQKVESLLGGYRVLDLSNELGVLMGKMLGDMGADVIKIEKPGGDPMRNIGPFYRDIPDPEKSLYWFTFNTSKRGITLDIEKRDGQELFKKLVKTADFVIECFEPGYMDGLGLGYEALEKINPSIIVTSLTPFGQTGPYAHWKSYDLTTTALSGLQWLCGDQHVPPVRFTTQASHFETSVQAVAATMIAHCWRGLTGEGQHVDVSAQEALHITTDTAQQAWYLEHYLYIRGGGARYNPPRKCLYPCKDGYFLRFSPEDLPAFLDWFDEVIGIDPEVKAEYLKEWDEAAKSGVSLQVRWGVDKMNKFFDDTSGLLMALTKKELYEGAKARHFGWSPVNTVKDIVESEQIKVRDFIVELEHPELGETIRYPGVPCKLSEAPLKLWRRAPLIGEHNGEVYEKELGLSKEELVFLKQAGVI